MKNTVIKKAGKAAHAEKSDTPSIIIQNLTIRPVNRQRHDIEGWRNAIKSAETSTPRRVTLYDLYDDLLLDGHLYSILSKRINAVANAKWEFVKDGKVIDQVNDLIDTPEFEELITGIMNAKFWGYSMMEVGNFTPDGFTLYDVPKKHMRPKIGVIAKEQSTDEGINIREGIYAKTVMEVGKPDDLGILRIVAQYVIYKRGGFGDWAQFAELFGMPFRVGKYDGYDDTQRIQLEKAMEEAGSAAYVVIPKESDIEFMENKTTGEGQLYKFLKDACNQEISVTILGQTETTTSSESSGYAQSKTHAETEEDINKADRNFVRRILNRYFIRIMDANGVNTDGGRFVIKGEGEEKLSKKDAFSIHKQLIKDLNLPIDDNFLYEEYGMPKPDDYDQQKAAMLAEKQQNVENDRNGSGDDPAHTPPGSAKDKIKKLVMFSDEESFFDRLKNFFV